MLKYVDIVPVPLIESLGTVTGKYPAKDKITSSAVDLLGEESIQRLLHITDTNNPYRFDLRRGALARVAGGGIHFSDEIYKNKKDLIGKNWFETFLPGEIAEEAWDALPQPDRTAIARELGEKHPEVTYFSASEPNYGLALREGIERSKGTYVMCDEIDLCDTDFHARALARLRESLNTLPFFGGTKVVWFKNCNFYFNR